MTANDIPPLARPEDMPPIRAQTDVWRHWRALMGPLGFSERLLWLAFFAADGSVTPALPQITELPELPDAPLIGSLMEIRQRLCDDLDGGSVARLLSRPGRPGITAAERTWSQQLSDAATSAGVRMWPVHVANDHELVTVTPNDLAEPRAASG